MVGAQPRWVAGLASLVGLLAGLASMLQGQGPGTWVLGLALALLWPLWCLGRRVPAPVTLRVSACGRRWQLGSARQGWRPVRPVARWQTGAWMTLDFAEDASAVSLAVQHPQVCARPPRPQRCVLWRRALAPRAWRRLAALSAASLARRGPAAKDSS